ncbi:extracellular triacylglycerol lipase precursor [Daedaleopsis nitida]|nr:extracellular triacylglycerol lipase precursor [Daedaleopsis nitida]
MLSGPQLAHAATQPQVTVGKATVVGTTPASGVDFFGGIPYAQPPLGDLRFAPPVLMDTPPAGSLDASAFGAACVQYEDSTITDMSEDCLTLNVFRPSGVSSTAKLPVMVWIFGGGFVMGSPAKFDASTIIGQSVQRGTPVVYVSINYRVGPFGFPQGSEAEDEGSLNLALKDQVAGLQWVQKNIAAFGGDPTKVTIFGQSAGAILISSLFLNSGLENYVRGAILQSSSANTYPLSPASTRDTVWSTFVSNVPACAKAAQGSTFSCLRTADTAALLTAWEQTTTSLTEPLLFGPVIDGSDGVIPDLPSKLFAAGKFSKIPFIAGTVLDEGTRFTPQSISTDDQVKEFLTGFDQPFTTPSQSFENDLTQLLTLYPDNPALGSPYGTGNNTFGVSSQYKRAAAIYGDAAIQATRRAWIRAATNAGVKTFAYLFADQNAVTDPSLGVSHETDVPYVYGTVQTTSSNAGARLLSQAMVDYWVSFAVSGTPNDGKGLKRDNWPQYQANNEVVLQLDTTAFQSSTPTVANFAVIQDDYRSEQISFLNSVQADLNQ